MADEEKPGKSIVLPRTDIYRQQCILKNSGRKPIMREKTESRRTTGLSFPGTKSPYPNTGNNISRLLFC